MSNVVHPLAVNMRIQASFRQCACRGAQFKTITGKILKVINNHSGTWYYLDAGMTVKADWVTAVI